MERKKLINELDHIQFSIGMLVDDIRSVVQELEGKKEVSKPEPDSYDDLFIKCGLPPLDKMSVADIIELEQVLRNLASMTVPY